MAYLTGPNQTVTRVTEIKEGYEDTNQGQSNFSTMKKVILAVGLLSIIAFFVYLYKNRKPASS